MVARYGRFPNRSQSLAKARLHSPTNKAGAEPLAKLLEVP